MLAAHDGPETGEDGPTHHGLFWMSLFTAYPGIKVYKPLDANEAIEMLFHAAQRGEPVVFSAVRPGVPVLKRGDGVPPAREAINGAYVFKPFRDNGKPKKVLAISGGQVMANVLEILPEIEERMDVKIVAVTRPQLYEELRRDDPGKGRRRSSPTTSASTWSRCITGGAGSCIRSCCPPITASASSAWTDFSRSGKPDEIYHARRSTRRGCGRRFGRRSISPVIES